MTEPASEKFSGPAKVLIEFIEHNTDEKEQVMFKAAKKPISSDELEEFGKLLLFSKSSSVHLVADLKHFFCREKGIKKTIIKIETYAPHQP